MTEIGSQILTALCGAMIVSILGNFADGSTGKILKLLGGVFLSLTIMGSFLKLDFDLLENLPVVYLDAADLVAAEGEKTAQEAMGTIIKEETEAYILDKAKALNPQVQVEVILDHSEIPVPHSVRLFGEFTGAERESLEEFLESELNIPKERQQWIGGT